MKKRAVFIYFFAVLSFAAVFLLFSSVYLQLQIKNARVSGTKRDEPYYTGPENCGLLFKFFDGDCFLYLDFKNKKVTAKLTQSAERARIDDMPVNYTVNADLNLLAGIIDRTGGIELETEAGTQRFTGEQTVEMLGSYPQDTTLKKDVLAAIFYNISKNGFSKSDFVYIIENSDTDLPVIDCLYWQELMPEIARNVEVIP